MKKTMLTAALLTLSLAVAQTVAPTTTPVPASMPTDVPNNHWANDAVRLLMGRGIILGYPDGTYRGNQTMTRYEVATLLARVLQQNLLATPSAQASLSAADLDVIARGVAQVADLLATIDVRLRDAVTDIDNLKSRMALTEQALQQVVTVAVTRTELEASVMAQSTETQAALAAKADTANLILVQAQVEALQVQLAAMQAADAAKAQGPSAAEQAAMTQAAGINGQVFDDPASVPNARFAQDSYSPLYVGGGVGYQLGSGRSFGVVLGSDRVLSALGGLGLRASGNYSDASRSYSVQANVTKTFNTTNDARTSFSPYAGLGAGVLVSPTPGEKAVAANDFFVSALGGVNYNFTETLRLYAEVDGRYFLGTKGVGTGATSGKPGTRFGVGLGAGIKVYF